MAPRHSSVSEAYATLGLEQGSPLDIVKSTYKQLALRTHPDKNPNNADATAQFQRICEAYDILLNHHDKSARTARGPFGSPFGFPASEGNVDDEEDFEDEDGYYYYAGDDDEEEEEDIEERLERMAYFMYVFDRAMGGHDHPSSRHQGARGRPSRRPATPEAPEQYEARMRRTREDQVAAEERRKREAAARKVDAGKQRERERREAEERQRVKASKKKAEAATSKQKAETAARAQKQRVQTLRSDVFAAARVGDAAKVRKGVWEDEVDAAGGEVKEGCAGFVEDVPDDGLETLLHISARTGDVELVKWLDTHSADPEERDSNGYTAFHIALQQGHVPVLNYFVSTYSPKESESQPIYRAPPGKSPLSLALNTYDPEVVWIVLDKGLAPPQDIANAWAWVSSQEGKRALLRDGKSMKGKGEAEERYGDIRSLLMSFGGFTPPPTPKPEQNEQPPTGKKPPPAQKKQENKHGSQTNGASDSPQQRQNTFVANGNGRGRGSGRGRGRGRGRRAAPVV